MRRQGLKWTKEKLPNTDLMDKIKANVVYFTTVEPSTTKEGKYILRYMRTFTHHFNQGEQIHLCNVCV